MFKRVLAGVFVFLIASLPLGAHATCPPTRDALADAFCEGQAADAATADFECL